MRRPPSPTPQLLTLALAFGMSASGCPCIRGVVNDSPGLRWWLFSKFGASRVCPEVLKRGAPIRIAALGPNSIGRFFPQQCSVQVDDEQRTMALSLGGDGYAHLPGARRTGFSAQMTVEYRPDFRLEKDATWVWGIYTRTIDGPQVRLLGVENVAVSLATKIPLVGDVAAAVGQGVLSTEVARGFTVVHTDQGNDFSLGIRPSPSGGGPSGPASAGGESTAGANLTEVHPSSRDYLGPFEVASDGRQLRAWLRVTGAPASVTIVDKTTGDAWRQPYEAAQPLAPPPALPIYQAPAPLGESTHVAQLPRGLYYVVIENAAKAPITSVLLPIPLPSGSSEATAVVSYNVE